MSWNQDLSQPHGDFQEEIDHLFAYYENQRGVGSPDVAGAMDRCLYHPDFGFGKPEANAAAATASPQATSSDKTPQAVQSE